MVRRIDIGDTDIAKYQFDYDLVFAVIFLNANEKIYGRYGSRGPWSSGSRVSLAGLKYTMRQILQTHDGALQPDRVPTTPVLARQLRGRRGCMHCHQVWEDLRRKAKAEGTFDPQSLFVYPLPENIGLRLDVDEGNRVVNIKKDSPCAKVDLKQNDVIVRIGAHPIYSQADVGWALHNAPREGGLAIRYRRGEVEREVQVRLKRGWKKTRLAWRPSMREE